MSRWCTIAIVGAMSTVAVASPLATDDRRPWPGPDPLVISRPISVAGRLTAAMAAAARPGIVAEGTAAARQALADCRKGDYPGGGSGLLSLPAPGRTNAQSDHCWR